MKGLLNTFSLFAFVILQLATVGSAPLSVPPVPLPSQVPQHPIDPGKLSLLQVHDGDLINMRDGSSASYGFITFVDGRTRLNRASRVFLPGYIHLPVDGNLALETGSLIFWVSKEDWASTSDDWFFRVDIDGPFPFVDNFQVRKWIDGNLYWGYELYRGVYPVFQLDPNSWHLIAVTWDLGNKMSLYLDGKFIREIPLPQVSITSTRPYFNWGEWGGLDCKCVEEDMQTFSYVLSADQVNEIYLDRLPAKFYKPGR